MVFPTCSDIGPWRIVQVIGVPQDGPILQIDSFDSELSQRVNTL